MGRPISGLKRHIQAHCHSAKKTAVSIRYRLGMETYIQARVGGRKKSNAAEGDSESDDSTEEQLQCIVHCFLLLFRNGHVRAPNPCFISRHETTEPSNANMKSLTPRWLEYRSRVVYQLFFSTFSF